MAASPAVLVGRETELAQLRELVQAAGEGRSSVLVLEGDPGVGKSALLRSLVESSTGFQVLWAQGLESEVELPYGGLGQLLRPLQVSFTELSPQHVDMLTTVFATTGMQAANAPSAGLPDRYAAAAAALALLAAAAETGPIIAVVDDAQWLDQPSVEALAFIAHRLLAEGIVLLLSRRNGEGDVALGRLPSVTVDGIDAGAAAELLRTLGAGILSGSQVEHLVAASNGNPLALLELPRLLSAEQLASMTALDQPLPIGEALLRAYSQSFEQLSERCRQAALIVAILDEPDVRTVELALRQADLSIADISAAEDIGLVTVEPSGVSFRHPLVRSAATFSVPPSWRRRAHSAAASALSASTAANKRLQRAWHVALASVGSDESAAALLESAAEQAAVLSGFSAACAAHERAAQLSPYDRDGRRRLLRAADAALQAGLTAKADELVTAAAALTNDDLAASMAAAEIKSRIDLAQGRLQDALTGAAAAAEAASASQPLEAARLLLNAVTAAVFLGDTESASRFSERAIELSEGDPVSIAVGQAALGSVLVVRGESAAGLDFLMPIVEPLQMMIPGDVSVLEPVSRIALSFLLTDNFSTADELISAVISKAVEVGAITTLPISLICQASSQFKRGDWRSATASAYRSLGLARDVDQVFQIGNALGMVAVIEANRGREAACRESVNGALAITSGIGAATIEALAFNTLGVLELGLRNFEKAVSGLERSQALCGELGLREFGHFQWPPELSEAYVRLGRT